MAGLTAPDAGKQPVVFAPGDERISGHELRSFSQPQALTRERSYSSLSTALIMMIDDEMLNIKLTRAFLAEAGYSEFVHTDQPEQALAVMRSRVPAVLLLDLSMPRMSGIDILEVMRGDPLLRHVPVIVLTGSMDPQLKLQALALGAMDFLSKPVDPSELGLRIRNTLAASAHREYLASHDALTDLPNKHRYRTDAAVVIADAVAAGESGAVLHVGVDSLGRVNDALGRAVGDQLLQRVAKRLANCVQFECGGELSSARHEPALYRFDGDEFAIVVPVAESSEAASFITRLLEDAAVNFRRPGMPEVFVTCSVGVSVFPDDGTDADLLMRNAGLAMRHAKRQGPHRFEFFSASLNVQAKSELDVGAELRGAIGRNEIDLLHEPVVELASGRVIGAHAMLRWRHPSGRVVLGEPLLQLAARLEMDVALTEWAFDRICRDVKNWEAGALVPVAASLEATLVTMRPSELASMVQDGLAEGLNPRHVKLVLNDVRGVESLPPGELAAIAGLRTRGVRVAMAHMGSGTSFSQLRVLDCDEVHVDQCFLEGVDGDERLEGLLLSMREMARRLRLKSMACGVHSDAQLAVLKAQGWYAGRGPLFGRAVSSLVFASKYLAKTDPPRKK
ncbi:MAG: hypothetical protein NVS2B4_06960 [Ramlibacter sp.]